ncbi:DNA integrity scanning diadenylate cyclase DisA [Candidatus Pacearchaeota archaeon]|nr:hypothetical protein [uncultured archaeon]MBS3084405.1 DNA integrity scanning diadenylate cyclase DisA [Candidatus Pacearchaeota archaeon]
MAEENYENPKTEEIFLPFSKEKMEGELGKDFMDVLKMVAPGTSLRVALDDFLNAKMGALIVLDNGNLGDIVEGGFKVNTKFSAQKLVELAKMDGAIILSKDVKEILNVNTLLFPSISISTKETGTRHKAAERTAKQAKTIVIAVSERKNKISLYYGDSSYQLERSSEILRRASETLQILEKQRDVFDNLLLNLNSLELRRHATITDVCMVLQRVEIMKRVSEVVERYLIELGKEGTIVKMRLKELMGGLQKEEESILKDYFGQNHSSSLEILEKMDFDFLLEPMNISRLLFEELHDKTISPRGVRLLGKTNLLERYIDLLIGNFENLSEILSASNEELLEILGSEAMLSFFREEVYNLKEKVNLGKGL